MAKLHRITGVLMLMFPVTLIAGAMEDSVLAYMRAQTSALSGRVEIGIEHGDPRQALPSCRSYETSLPAGARASGRVAVAVRCAEGGSVTAFVPVRVRVFAPVLVASRTLAPGQLLAEDDVARQELEITHGGTLSDTAQAVGKRIAVGLTPGAPLRREMLRTPPVIAQGDTVRVRAAGAGFMVAAEGVASAHAADGQTVQVRMAGGRTVTGIARPERIVEVKF